MTTVASVEPLSTTQRRDLGRRIAFLDAVRGVAAMVVVLQHLLELYSPSFLRWSMEYLNFGRIGVVAFFLVSGYVIPLSLGNQGLRVFAIRRFFRLYPVYWLALVAYIGAEFAALKASGSLTASSVLINLTMIQGLLGLICLLPPAWTLGIELFYYFQSAFAAWRGWLHSSIHFGWLWLGAYLAASMVTWVAGIDLPTTLPLLLFIAAVGHSLYLRDSRGSSAWKPLTIAGLVLVPAAAWPATSIGPTPEPAWGPISYGMSVLAGALLFAACYALRRKAPGRFLLWLGAISYSVYLFHPVVMQTLRHWLSGWLLIGACLAAIPLLSHLTYKLVELPSIKAGRRLSTRRPSATPPPSKQEGAPLRGLTAPEPAIATKGRRNVNN